MVKIPELEEDGQNWKIYREKYLEVAATERLLSVVAGWELDDGSKDWDHRNRTARTLFYITLPPSFRLRIQPLENAREVFRYLQFYFLDLDPIEDPRAKKLATSANEANRVSAATVHATNSGSTHGRTTRRCKSRKRDTEDLSTTKDLSRGTEDVDDGNVGREDPRTSVEALAKGTSATSADGTVVLLTGEPHETQNVPQDSLPLTPRPPIEGEPNACKQEATDGVVTAELMKGMVEMAEPRETVADVDRTALLGGEPAERVCGVDEGDETEHDSESRLQQTQFYYEEGRQHDENANRNVPKAHGLPLEGEWLVCACGEATNSNGDADASNAAVECVYCPSESRVTEDAMENESKGCEGGMDERASVDEADSNPGRAVKRADAPNELTQLLTTTIESYVENGETDSRVCLGGTCWRADDANGVGNRADGSTGQADGLRGLTDVLRTSNGTETASKSHSDEAGTYLGVGDAKRVVNTTDGVGSRMDALTGHRDVQCVETDAYITANATETVSAPRKRPKPPDSPFGTTRTAPDEPNGVGDHADGSTVRTHASCVGNDAKTAVNATETVSTPRKESKTQNSPMETARWTPDEPDGCGSHADASSVRRDAHCGGNETETAADEAERVRTHQNESRTRNSPNGREIAMAKLPSRWRRVSAGDGDVYVPWNAPIEALDTANRRLAFGEVESGVEAIAPSAKGERAGDGDGDGGRNGDVGDVDGTTSGGDADSMRVEAVLLAGESQRVRYSRRRRIENLPVSSRPPIQRERRPYGAIRRRRRRGRLKIERINVSQTKQVETTHLGLDRIAQPPRNAPDRAYGIVRPRRRRGRIKIAPINVSRTRIGGNTYLGRVNAIQSTRRPKKQTRRVNTLTFESRMPGEPWRDDEDYG